MRRRLSACLVALLGAAAMSSAAHAEVLHLPSGQFVSVAPHQGVPVSALPGAVARTGAGRALTSSPSGQSSASGLLGYDGGPVVHSSAPYLILWTPSGQALPTGSQSVLTRYFTDVASASGSGSNVYGVLRQFFDNSGFADYRQSFSPATQVITDTQAYPRSGCSSTTSTYSTCLTDSQVESEIQRVITAQHLPTDGPAYSESLPATAPIYFMVLPTDVNVCASWGCANSSSYGFCAYHSTFTDSANHTDVLYATIPTLITGPGQNAKACQYDGNAAVQEPNATAADVALKYLSHEDGEALTDPFGDAWYDPNSGNEGADNCNAYGASSPSAGTSPNAFAPVSGGSPTGSPFGSLYNQVIGGHPYYLQSEWSNGGTGCDLRPGTGTIAATFTAPGATTPPGTPLSFDPSASTSTHALTSATWSFGDNSASTFNTQGQTLVPAAHTYAADGTYTVTLTLVDNRGNLTTVTHVIHVDDIPTAAFRVTTSGTLGAGQATAFDAGASSDSDGTISSYAWNFGDGQTATGATPNNIYQTAGTYTVTLTVTDSDGQSATTSQTVSVAGPTPTFSTSSAVENTPVSFDGTGSGDTLGSSSITSEVWNFGDGSTQSGSLTATHTFAQYGSYFVTLTLTDSAGFTSSYTRKQIVADEPPIASYLVSTAAPGSGQGTAFDATASSDPDGTIVGYAWNFGDGQTATGATPTHVFAGPGHYTVALTVTDSDGETATTTETVAVAGPVSQFSAPAPQLEGTTLSFSAGAPGPQAATPVTYAWNFGDGATATGPSATHAYATAGIYTVALTVTDANGDVATSSHLITVLDEAPTAAFGVLTPIPSTQRAVAFAAGASADPDGTVSAYAWQFGDGTFATGASPTHLYTAPGTYTVTLTVTDSGGQSSPPVSHQVTVFAAPQATFTIAGNGAADGSPVGFDASASADPGAGGPIARYDWSFGDGTTAAGVSTSHAYGRPGDYPVTLTVTNAVGLSVSLTQFVTIGDEAPTVSASASPRIIAGQATSFDARASDPDGSIVTYKWDFGDHHSSSSAHPTHTYMSAGPYTVMVTVTAGDGSSATASVPVLVLAPGRITRVQVGQGSGGLALVISVNGAGHLRVGNRGISMRGGGSTRVRLTLSSGQLRALGAHRTIRVRTAIAFTPVVGPPSHRTLTISLWRPGRSRRYNVKLR